MKLNEFMNNSAATNSTSNTPNNNKEKSTLQTDKLNGVKVSLNGVVTSTAVEMLHLGSQKDASLTSLMEGIKLDFAAFLMFLAGADGQITPEEAEFISYFSEKPMSAQNTAQFAELLHINTPEFLRKTPGPLQIAIFADQANNTHDLLSEADTVVGMYEILGETFMDYFSPASPKVRFYYDKFMNVIRKHAAVGKTGRLYTPTNEDCELTPSSLSNGSVKAPKKS